MLYRFDPTHTFVHFEVVHFGASTLRGRFGPIDGAVTIDRAAQRGELSLVIPVASVSTGVPALDTQLRSPELLGSDEAFFVANRFAFDAGRVAEVRGEFTLRGVSQGLSLKALRFACYTSPLTRREVCGGEFEGQLLRSSVGATLGLPFVADRVRLVVDVEAARE